MGLKHMRYLDSNQLPIIQTLLHYYLAHSKLEPDSSAQCRIAVFDERYLPRGMMGCYFK